MQTCINKCAIKLKTLIIRISFQKIIKKLLKIYLGARIKVKTNPLS